MAYSSKSSSFNKILILVFGIAFGFVALALVYQGAKTSSDIRSRAAQETRILKSWEFNGTTSEGWQQQPNTITVSGGYLNFTVMPNQAQMGLENTTSFTIPTGIRNFQINLRITTPKPAQPVRSGKLVPTPTPVPQPVSVEVHFQKNTGATKSRAAYTDIPGSTLTIKAAADGQFHAYNVPFPNTLAVYTVDKIVLTFTYLKGQPKTTTSIDYIRITQTVIPTPRPCVQLPSCAYSTDPRSRICKIGATPAEGGTWCPRPTITKEPVPTGSGCITRCDAVTKLCTTACPATVGPRPTIVQSPPPTAIPTATPTATPTPMPIQHSLSIVSPNGGETLTIGVPYTIRWNSSGTFTYVDLQYVTDGGFSAFIGHQIPDTGSYKWNVNTLFGKGQYKIYIYGYTNGTMTANDASNAFFTIVLSSL